MTSWQEDVLKYLDDVYPDKNKTFKVVSRRARKNYPEKFPGDQLQILERSFWTLIRR